MDPIQPLVSTELRDNWQGFLDINGLAGHSATLDHVMVFGANDLIFALPLVLLLVWFVLARWSPFSRWLARRVGAGEAERDRWLGQRALLSAVVGVGLALCLNILLGALIFEPRPFISHPSLAHKLIAHAADASFPSDHEAVAMSIALTLVFYVIWLLGRFSRERAGARLGRVAPALLGALLAVAMAVLIGFARVYVGVHYPIDIVGGAVCAAVGVALAFGLLPLTGRIFQPVVQLAAAVGLA
ncbi:MAG TPA: phosphatase PAP2 family protein [Ktedonobacterales bacterium]|nr:phosphatase PAP2 family protein [Ktedonobacterales bacterium]